MELPLRAALEKLVVATDLNMGHLATWEKKRKEKEAKFFQEADIGLNKCISTRVDEFTNAVNEMNGVYEKFILDYAGIEDEIRKIWTELLREQQRLRVLSEQKLNRVSAGEQERERGQVQGMAIAKKAMEDYTRLVTALRPSE
ncbi:uncharacterized protein FIBRA_04192 [Fibroporia radiculosa]|uniref:Uncharacterized protein n=1 Tax=Fibroporia radiculosa TaxID=599839 RepID=J4GNZ1_9APHY|nr:uncharacterized protein FIBRA_04192 [Fibroporia radiculosa]CCM02115.1 predicted protein [Fibroporia radiculosa]